MFVELNPSSESGDKKGSCKKYAQYLLKDNTHFFNHSNDQISLDEAVKIIDANNKKGLGKNDDKWFAPIYNLAEDEAQHICRLLFNKSYSDYNELSSDEKKKYNEYIVDLGKKFMDDMALSFNLQEKNVNSGNDLFYIAVVENKRLYTGHDEDVKNNLVKSRTPKKGFNTHIHVIQGRLANNGFHSKISPLRTGKNVNKNNIGANTGFDRVSFYNKIEMTLDIHTGYKRSEENTFDYQNAQKKKKENSTLSKVNIVLRRKKKFFTKDEAKDIVDQISLDDYVSFLVKNDRLKIIGEKEDRRIFLDTNTDRKYIIYENGFLCEDTKQSGNVINLIRSVEELNWIDSLNRVIQVKNLSSAIIDKKGIELYQVKPAHVDFLFENNPSYSKLLLKNNLNQLRYLSEGKRFLSIGLATEEGGIVALSKDSLIYKGARGSSFIKGDKDRNNLIVFDNLTDYLNYLKYKGTSYTKENVLLLNDLQDTKHDFTSYDNVVSFSSRYKNELIQDNRNLEKEVLNDKTKAVQIAVENVIKKMK